jgi:hypothetical protein
MDFYNCRIGAWQRRFLVELFEVIVQMRGRVNFTNMARYSRLGEQTFRRHFQKGMDWVALNLTMLRLQRHPRERLIGVFDCTFVPKSGTASYGLGSFFSSALQRRTRGQEVSVLGVVATESRRAFAVDATQTPSGLPRPSGYSAVDVYVEQIRDLQPRLAEVGVSCWVGDGFYAKQKVFDAMAEMGATFITRLRSDANLRYLYTGPPTGGPGRQRRYDGKIIWSDPAELERRFDEIGRLTDRPDVEVWTTLANSPHFRRDLRIVLLRKPATGENEEGESLVLASTDPAQPPDEIVRLYRLRYQIEFVIRDAKQHAGLTHCQARSQSKIDFHLNASLAAVNLLRFLAARSGSTLGSVRRWAYNRMLAGRLFSELGLCGEWDLSDPEVQPVLHTGRMAA